MDEHQTMQEETEVDPGELLRQFQLLPLEQRQELIWNDFAKAAEMIERDDYGQSRAALKGTHYKQQLGMLFRLSDEYVCRTEGTKLGKGLLTYQQAKNSERLFLYLKRCAHSGKVVKHDTKKKCFVVNLMKGTQNSGGDFLSFRGKHYTRKTFFKKMLNKAKVIRIHDENEFKGLAGCSRDSTDEYFYDLLSRME